MIWEHHIPSGAVYNQQALSIIQDIDGDGYDDVIVGSAWGGRLIRAISGKTGEEIWTHYTNNYGSGGWVYSVDSTFDYNGDGIPDVIATAGDDSNGLGPKRVYCLNGATGVPLWERPVNGPAFSAIGVEDFTGNGIADVVAHALDGKAQHRFDQVGAQRHRLQKAEQLLRVLLFGQYSKLAI